MQDTFLTTNLSPPHLHSEQVAASVCHKTQHLFLSFASCSSSIVTRAAYMRVSSILSPRQPCQISVVERKRPRSHHFFLPSSPRFCLLPCVCDIIPPDKSFGSCSPMTCLVMSGFALDTKSPKVPCI